MTRIWGIPWLRKASTLCHKIVNIPGCQKFSRVLIDGDRLEVRLAAFMARRSTASPIAEKDRRRAKIPRGERDGRGAMGAANRRRPGAAGGAPTATTAARSSSPVGRQEHPNRAFAPASDRSATAPKSRFPRAARRPAFAPSSNRRAPPPPKDFLRLERDAAAPRPGLRDPGLAAVRADRAIRYSSK